MEPKIDQNIPLFIGSSYITGVALFPIKLTRYENYGIWSTSMKITLLGKHARRNIVVKICMRNKRYAIPKFYNG